MTRLPLTLTASCALALTACEGGSSPGSQTDGGSTGATDGPPTAETTTGTQETEPEPTLATTANPATDGSGETAGSTSDGSSTGEAPAEGIPVIVSLAHGGQTARSCDGGQTWANFHEYGIQDDHSDYAAFGGLTFGNGAFVAATGWGAPAHILRSTDGVTWDDIPDEAFVTAEGFERPTTGASGVEFTGDGFVLFAGPHLWRSDDGEVWTTDTPASLSHSGHFREVEYLAEPGLLLVATEEYDAQGVWTIQVSADAGATWQLGTGVTAGCGGYVQHVGGFAAWNGRLLLGGGSGPTCISDDEGRTWTEAANVGAEIADVDAYEGGFVVLTQSGQLVVSDDAQAWTPLGETGLDGGRLGWTPALGFFGEGAGLYAHSPNGADWAAATSRTPSGYVHVREFAVGQLASCN